MTTGRVPLILCGAKSDDIDLAGELDRRAGTRFRAIERDAYFV